MSALDHDTVASLLESVGGDKEFLAELFSAFAEEAPSLVASIERSVAVGDSEALRHAAHTLKSTGASLGALPLSNLSQELEELGRSGTIPEVRRIAELRTLVEEAVAAMAAISSSAGLDS